MEDPSRGTSGDPSHDLSRFCCHNPDCPLRGRRGAGNLSVCGTYGKHETFRLLYCRSCKARFGERKGTPLFNARLPAEKAVSVLEHLADGCGVRQTARLAKVNRKTVGRLALKAGSQAKALHDELVAFSPTHPRGADGREVVVRRKEAGELRRGRRPRRR
jgi:transposase-like protein